MVTDFGYGSNWYLDTDKSGVTAVTGASGGDPSYTYGWYEAWSLQSLQVNGIAGQLTIPSQAQVPQNIVQASTTNGTGSAMSLSSFLGATDITNFAYAMGFYFGPSPTPNVLPIDSYVTGAGSAALDPEEEVYIGAPTTADIKALAPSPNEATPWVQQAAASGTTPQGVPGLGPTPGSSTSYITNTSQITCNNTDAIIDGTLVLSNAQIEANSGGCRLYVTGAVFIEGPITYVSPDSTANLQISSAEAIFLGVGLSGVSDAFDPQTGKGTPEASNVPLDVRLLNSGDARDPEIRSAPSTSQYNSWSQSVYNEGANVGASVLIDASKTAPASWGAGTAQSYVGQTRTSIDYTHLLLNAPVVHSRYLGSTTGVIVGEIAEFSLGSFNFNYDEVFTNADVPILPALLSTEGLDILCVGAAGITCNPAQ